MPTEILRPNAAGDECSISDEGTTACPNHWQDVDDESADDATTEIKDGSGSYKRDLYNLTASSGSGTINFIKVYFRIHKNYDYENGAAKPSIKSNSTITDGSAVSCPHASWVTYSQQWNTNPADSEAWEWADIDDLQIGVSLYASIGTAQCTQVYVVVDYTVAPTEQAVGGGSVSIAGALVGILKHISAVGSGSIAIAGALGRNIAIGVGTGAVTITGALAAGMKRLLSVGSGAVTMSSLLFRNVITYASEGIGGKIKRLWVGRR